MRVHHQIYVFFFFFFALCAKLWHSAPLKKKKIIIIIQMCLFVIYKHDKPTKQVFTDSETFDKKWDF